MIIFTGILLIIFIDNKNISIEKFELEESSLTTEQVKVVHLSDLHFPKIKVDIEKMIESIKNETPDIIAITGDLIDQSAVLKTSGVENFISKVSVIAKTYYVSGNHERGHKEEKSLYDMLEKNNIEILKNEMVDLSIRGVNLTIMGLRDNAFYDERDFLFTPENVNNYKILLAHRPEHFELYSKESKNHPNLVLSGHAHGGQIRIFNQGVVAPNQGLFPEYDAGLYKNNETYMIVSRGIGNSILPYRINNKPHIPVITINIEK